MKQKKLDEFLKALLYENKYYRFNKKQILIEFIEKMV